MTDILTLGHSNRSMEDFLAVVAAHGIAQLVDVRSWPRSRRFPWFDGPSLSTTLHDAGIRYVWEGRDLGGNRSASAAGDRHSAVPEPGFRAYAAHMTTPTFAAAVTRVMKLAAARPTALMCAERDPAHCHRAFLADFLVHSGHTVHHAVSPEELLPHALHPALRTDDGELVYDRHARQGLGF